MSTLPSTRPLARPRTQIIVAVLWPAFVVAGIANSLFFVAVDPMTLADSLMLSTTWSATGVYSMGFFCCWIITTVSSAATQYLLRPITRREP